MNKIVESFGVLFILVISLFPSFSFSQYPDWEKVEINSSTVNSIINNSDGILFAGTYSGVYKSDDDGSTWVQINSGLSNKNINVLSINAQDELFAGTFGGVFFSDDHGNTWAKRDDGLTFKKVRTMLVDENNHIYVGASDSTEGIPSSIYLSKDNANSWTEIKEGLYGGDTVKDFITGLEDTVYAVTNGGGLIQSEFMYKWDASENNWDTVYRFAPNIEILRLNRSFSGWFYGGESHGLIRSKDKGLNWEPAGLYPRTVLSIISVSDSVLFAGTFYYGIYHSEDAGNTWHHHGLAENNIIELKITQSGILLAGTENNGVYRQKLVATNNEYDSGRGYIPHSFTLNQNYPNPFNPNTIISYQLPMNSKVLLEVFDMAGKKITTLVNHESQAAGHYEINFDASALSSGVYIYRLYTENFSQSRKMVLIK